MKLHEEILDILSEIDDDLLPAPLPAKKPSPWRKSVIRWTASAAAVIAAVFGGLWLGRLTSPNVSLPEIVFASDIIPRYLANNRSEQILTSDQLLTVSRLTGISREPQIFLAETAAEIVLPDNAPFTDRNGQVWRMYTIDSAADDLLERNLRTDLIFTNYIRDYGCVLWQIDWTTEPSEVQYLGIVPLVGREEAVGRLLNGNYVTTIPASELPPDGITEERIGHRTLVYLLTPEDAFIRIYECFFVRLTDSDPADGESRFGLFYVPVTDEEQTAKLIEKYNME